jgi:GH15 family glucan-1,4-alpha-glucosidase
MSDYPPIRDLAAIGDGRTVALVARSGAVEWLCLPNLDSPSVFAALLDARRGGSFRLQPEGSFRSRRRYLPDTNVLETTYETGTGVARVTDAMTVPDGRLAPMRELVRHIEGVAGEVSLVWRVEPRFAYGRAHGEVAWRDSTAVITHAADALAVRSWDAGAVEAHDGAVGGRMVTRAGMSSLLALVTACREPLVFSSRADVERRFQHTVDFWRRWVSSSGYQGPWRDEVLRRALALKLLVHSPSGAVAAAATTSLPEDIGGERNWDYRYCWIRDTAFTLEALLRLGFSGEGHAFFWWFMHATRLTRPRVRVLYRLDGGAHTPERTLALEGYRGSRPVRAGNAAADQRQFDVYGELLQTAWLYGTRGHAVDAETGAGLGRMADFVCDLWREPDQGIWEVRSTPRHFTQSKAMCWVALDRACRLADLRLMPSSKVARWRREQADIERFIEAECWSEKAQSYTRAAGSDELDASTLLMAVFGYRDPRDARMRSTVKAVARRLGRGPLVLRYLGEDGLSGTEGTFLACSFWLAHALAATGEVDEAARLMEELLTLSNDVGLYAEEIDPSWATSHRGSCTSRSSTPRWRSTRRGRGVTPRWGPRWTTAPPRPIGKGDDDDGVGSAGGRVHGNARVDDHVEGRDRARPHADGPPVPARDGADREPPAREGGRLRAALRVRAGLRVRVLRPVPDDRPKRLGPRRAGRSWARRVRGHRPGQRAAARRAPAHGR